MLSGKDSRFTLDHIISQICKQGFCNRPQLLFAVWQSTKRVITTNWSQGRQTMLSNLFIARGNREFNKYYFYLQPTETLLADCALKYRAESNVAMQAPTVIGETNLFRSLNPPEKEYFKNDKELVLRFFYLLVGKVKDILKAHRNLEILFEHFGIIRVNEKTYFFESFKFNDKGSLSSPNLHKYKRFSSSKKEGSVLEKSGDESKLSSRILEGSGDFKRGFNLRKRPYFHEVIVENEPPSVKICGDLLGAGIDPLTYDYSYSKLADHSPELLTTEFKKQQHAQGRFPCVIDKFARTKGSQLTGIKVGNSIVVRIGSNYNPTAKNYYLDIASKSIQLVTPQAKIKLDNHRQRVIQPASEEEEYFALTQGQSPQLQARVQLRKEMYQRYCQYYQEIIPNDCVAPLNQESVARIIKQVKGLVKKLGRKDGSPLVNSLINEVNTEYYLAYKKSVLNYILRDKEEMVRIGISITFTPQNQWGKPRQRKPLYQNSSLNLFEARKILQLNHILYPECLNKIYEQNQKLTSLQIFKKRKEGEYRPYNILYYIKRNINQLNEAYTFLCDNWVKKIAVLIQEYINLKVQNYQKLKQFFNSIHIVMSNKLKELLYTTLQNITQEFSQCEYDKEESKNLLMINMTEEGEKICFIDDIEKVFRFELVDIIDKIVEVTRRIPRVENCLKLSTEMFIWGIDTRDGLLMESKKKIKQTIDENYTKILALREKLSKLEAVFKLKEDIVAWCKEPFKVEQLKAKLAEIQLLQRQIVKVNCYYKVSMVVVDCIELKRKMIIYLKSLKKLLFDSVEERVRQRNTSILAKINGDVQLVSKNVSSTTQFVSLAQDIELIKIKEMATIKAEIDSSYRDVMNLFSIQGFSANYEVMKSTYLCRQSFEELHFQLYKNERRLTEERMELQKKLREKISLFQTQTLTWLKEINSKIDTFDMRKLFSQYLAVLVDYQSKVDSNREVQRILNAQEEDLKWATTTFTHAVQLQNIVQPNYQLWQLVSEYDSCIKEWKYIELSHFDIENNEVKVTNIDNRITRLITKLKNFAGLKIVYDLQNDVKEFLVQQVPIIKIFSNPGLKDRHWSLFNKRLPLPGYDLKQLTYGRIKLLYEYEKNLKVLMSISNQAAKQFQIQNEKQEMFDYWSKLNFSLYHASDENIIFITQNFLDEQIEVIEHHLTKTVILKNSPFSKALVQMLSEWEGWLVNGRKILTGFRASQEKFMVVRSIFKMDEISKILPIESTEYDSIENIWKSVIKKILEQPKVTEFFKSQKMPEIIEEIGKKADFIRNSFNTYLNLKRLQFNRLYFLPQRIVLNLIQFLASDRLQQAYSLILQHCFIGIVSATRDDSSTFHMRSRTDKLQIMCETVHSKKGKAKFFEELVTLERNMRENIKKELKEISYLNQPLLEIVDGYTITAIFTYLQLQFGERLRRKEGYKEIEQYYKGIQAIMVQKLKEMPSLKYENILSKIFFIEWRCRELAQRQHSSTESILHFCESDEDYIFKIYNSSIKFQYEYLGDQMPCYLPSSTDRLVWSIAFSMNNKVGILCESNSLIREIALFTGQYFVRVENPLHSIESNFQSCIMGTVSTSYWIHFVDEHIKASANLLALLTHTYQLKKERIGRNLSTLIFKSNEISICTSTCLFLSILPQRRKEIPDGILTCMRAVSFVRPSIAKFKEYLSHCQFQERIRNFMYAIKSECQELKPNEVLRQTIDIQDWEMRRAAIKDRIWRLLSPQQRLDFDDLFQEKAEGDDIEYKSWSQFKKIKENDITWGLVRHSVVLAVGKQSCKSLIIEKILRERGVDTLFDENRGVNLNFIEEGASQLTYVKYLQKSKEKLLKFNDEIIIYIDCDLSAEHLQAISTFQHMHSLSLQHNKPMKIIVETCSIDDIDPKLLTSFAIVSFHPHHLVNISTYQEWVSQLNLIPQDKANVSQLEMSFESLLGMVLKMQKRLFNDTRPALTKRFFRYFSIYLQHLNSKQVERMCEFDRQNYIFNSFIYCAFWALGGNLRSIQAEALKKQIRESYAEKLDIPGQLNEIYLNEQNEWVYWQSLKEDFVSEKENIPVYQIWVPTANNTKILTMLIKLIENNHSILLCGSQSGRSSIFSEISSFELTYNTFLLDCHAKTSLNHITSLTRGRIIYGDYKKNLILVDDVHLPTVQACDVFRTFLERGYCVNSSLMGKLNEDIFKPLIVASWQGSEEHKRCFWRFYERMIPLQIEKFGQGELETILRTYFNSLPVSNQVDNNFLKLENIIVNFCLHTIKVFPSISISNIRLLVESMCRCNFSRDETTILQHLLAESQSILQVKLPAHQITHFYRHMSYYYGKLVSIQLKNHNEIKEVAQTYLYDVRSTKQADKKETAEQLGNWMHECIGQKSNQYFISPFHIKILQKMLWTLKANNSHIILLSNIKNGCHSLARMSGWLLKIGVIQLQQVGVNGLLQEVVKVLKTGGKIDECMSILTHELFNARPELIKLVNSLIFSPEFHECFGQILMEQIIKSFNSQKKFLKKNVKKSELIKKIRQKFNSIFHLCLCLTRSTYENLISDYPKFGNLRVIEVGEWPSQALSLVSKKFISNQSEEVLRVILRIEEELKSNWQIFGGKNVCKGSLKVLSTFDRIMKFMEQKAKSQEESTELWSKRIRLSQQKLENLEKEKKLFESQHTEYFQKMAVYGQQIIQVTAEAEQARQKQAQLDQDVEQYKMQCNRLKVEFDREESQVHTAYVQQIQSLKEKLTVQSLKYKESEKIEIISLAYEFPTNNLEQQITPFLYDLEKDYFHKLMELDYSDLGSITIIIDKFKDRMEALWIQQNYLSKKFKEYQNMHLTAYESGYKVKQLEDRVSILKDNESQLRENEEATMKAYEDIRDKIAQIESINSILLKFQHILKSKNELSIPVPKNMNGCALLVSYLLIYSSYLSSSQFPQFLKMITVKLQQIKLSTSIRQLLSFFSYELQFKILYQHQSNITEVVNLFGLESSDIACIGLGNAEDIVDWLGRITQGKQCVWMKANDDVKQLLQRDQLILIKNPDAALVEKISSLLSKPFIIRNNTKILIVEEQELTIHESSRCFFIFDTPQQIPEELLVHNLFLFRVFLNSEDKVLHFLENKLNEAALIPNRDQLVSSYLKGCRQIGMMDEKLHSIIMKMKKENVVSEIIYKKIEEEGENKLDNERKLEKYKVEISEISKFMNDYRPIAKEISNNFTQLNDVITFKEFSHILANVSGKVSTENLNELPSKVSTYLDLLLKEGPSKKTKDVQRHQFEELTLKVLQKSSIALLAPDVSLVHRFIKLLLSRSLSPTLDISPEDININNIKDGCHYICLLNRYDQWKQTLTILEAHRQKFAGFRIIFIVLDSVVVPPEIIPAIPTLSVKRIGELMMEVAEKEINLAILGNFKMRKDRTVYQQELEYRAYLNESKQSKEGGKIAKALLELE